MPRRDRRGPRRMRAMTYVEVLMAVSITALIGAAAAAVAVAVSGAREDSDDRHACAQVGRVARLRVAHHVHRASLVLGVDASRLAMWTGDANGDGAINLDELSVLEYVPDSGELHHHWMAFPDWFPDWQKRWLNTSYTLEELQDPAIVVARIQSSWYPHSEVIAGNLTSVAFHTDPDPPMTRFVRTEMAVSVGEASTETAGGATLRADRTDDVEQVGGAFRLSGE